MRRMSVFAWMVIAVLAAGAAPLLTASEARAQTTLLDPGWQIYSGNQNSGVNSGFIAHTFGDQSGQYAYQPAPRYRAPTSAAPRYSAPVYSAPAYYQPAPGQRRANQSAPQYYAVAPSPPPRGYQQPTPQYYAVAPAQRAGIYQQPQPQPNYAAAASTARRLSATSHAILCTRSGAAGTWLATFAGLLPAADGRRHRRALISRCRSRRQISRRNTTSHRNTASRRSTISCRHSCRNCSRAVIGRRPMRPQAVATWRGRSPSIRNTIVRSLTIRPASRGARSSSIPRTTFSTWCSMAAKRCATASASAARASPGPGSRKFRRSASGRTGGRRTTCSSGGPTCRASCPEGRKIRSARARSISARRSIASMAPTSRGRSAPRCRRAASACATRMSSTSTTA